MLSDGDRTPPHRSTRRTARAGPNPPQRRHRPHRLAVGVSHLYEPLVHASRRTMDPLTARRITRDILRAVRKGHVDLDRDYRREAKEYLEEFFRGIDRQGDVKSAFVDGRCNKKPTM